MSLDLSHLLKGLDDARRRQMSAAEQAVDEFAEHVLGDAQQLCPVDTGALQASGTTSPIQVQGETVQKEIGFHTDYAAAVHERLDNFFSGKTIVHPVGQAKFLTTALKENAPKLGPYIAAKLQNLTS